MGIYPKKKILEKCDYGHAAEQWPRKGTCLVSFGLGEASLSLWAVAEPELGGGGHVGGRAARKQMTSGCTVRSRKWARSLVAWLRSQLCRSLSVSAGNGRLNFSEPHTREESTISLIHCDKMHGKPLVQRTSQSQSLMNARYHETLNAPLFCASKRHPMCHPLPKEGRQLASRLAAVVPVCLPGTPGTLTPHPW